MNHSAPVSSRAPLLVIACGALATELVRIKRANSWAHVDVHCLPPHLHNRPKQITAAVERAIDGARNRYQRIFVAYGDCGTGGAMDRMLQKQGIERLPGAHCYEFLAGGDIFERLALEEPGTFYLTDFLVTRFRRLVIGGLGLDLHPELLPRYFGNYRRVVYLAQTESPELRAMARAHAACLGLEFQYRFVGDRPLAQALASRVNGSVQT